ncbi:MAG: low molecular weight phosphotyrosine protein phosphatase [Hellea sp.]|nr:low molecular weight phosphotyrosine protein phosphatase [Hellea sp.]MDG2362125.1 low molecular weight phosphotyrosine protein phosphatase [Hellea sp.]|tara:strand:+ start:176 stop:631 length:456 start_codon:yes stop_codon:yes gene_type:complete
MKSFLFVCLGNICRSPTAEAVFRFQAKQAGHDFKVSSAGTGAWHEGEPPDARSIKAGMKRGYDFNGQISRKITQKDFLEYDYILAMDKSNYQDLIMICPEYLAPKIRLFLDFSVDSRADEVPDPYYGGKDGFNVVIDLIEQASEGLILSLN